MLVVQFSFLKSSFLNLEGKSNDWCTLHDAEYILAAVAIRSIKNGRDKKDLRA